MLNEHFQNGFNAYSSNFKYMDGSITGTNIALERLSDTNSNCHYGGYSNNAFHVIIGAGTTTPTKTDYDLADSSIMAADKMASMTQSASWSLANGVVVITQ